MADWDLIDIPAGFYNNISTLCPEIQGAQRPFATFCCTGAEGTGREEMGMEGWDAGGGGDC